MFPAVSKQWLGLPLSTWLDGVATSPDPEAAWARCPRVEWMFQVGMVVGLPAEDIVTAALAVARALDPGDASRGLHTSLARTMRREAPPEECLRAAFEALRSTPGPLWRLQARWHAAGAAAWLASDERLRAAQAACLVACCADVGPTTGLAAEVAKHLPWRSVSSTLYGW